MSSTTVFLDDPGFYGGNDASCPACVRCGGLVVPEWLRDDLVAAPAWRCITCGDIVDSVILRNRGYSLPL